MGSGSGYTLYPEPGSVLVFGPGSGLDSGPSSVPGFVLVSAPGFGLDFCLGSGLVSGSGSGLDSESSSDTYTHSLPSHSGGGPDHRDQWGEHTGHDPRPRHRADQVRGAQGAAAAEERHRAGA